MDLTRRVCETCTYDDTIVTFTELPGGRLRCDGCGTASPA